MKATSIGPIALGVLIGGGGMFLYTHNTREESAKLTEKVLAIPAPASSENHRASTASSPIQVPVPAQAPAPTENKPVDASNVPIPLRYEFDAVMRKYPGNAQLHTKLEQEPRDPVWAQATEDAFRNFFQGNPEMARYGIPEIDCRTSICEIRLIAFNADKTTDWMPVAFKSSSSPRPKDGFPFGFASDEQNGVTAVIFHVGFAGRPGTLIKSPPTQ